MNRPTMSRNAAAISTSRLFGTWRSSRASTNTSSAPIVASTATACGESKASGSVAASGMGGRAVDRLVRPAPTALTHGRAA
jgi:hypothetical protein